MAALHNSKHKLDWSIRIRRRKGEVRNGVCVFLPLVGRVVGSLKVPLECVFEIRTCLGIRVRFIDLELEGNQTGGTVGWSWGFPHGLK